MWGTATNPKLVLLPERVFKVRHLHRGDIHSRDGTTQGWIGRRPGLGTALDHLGVDIVGELTMAALDALHTDAIREVDGSDQSGDERDIGRSDVLKALGFELWLVPSMGDDRIPDFAHDCVIAQIEKAGALGCL